MYRVLLLSLEYADPVFSGNGVLARTLVRSITKVSNCKVMVICGQPQGKQMSREGAESKAEWEQVATVRAVTLPKWFKLDRDSSWEAFGVGVQQYDQEIADYKPQIVLGIDWTSQLAFQTLQKGSCKNVPFVFLNFRVFGESSGVPLEDQQFYRHHESLCIEESVESIALCKNDANLLRNAYHETINIETNVALRVISPPLRQDVVVRAKSEISSSFLSAKASDKKFTSLLNDSIRRQVQETHNIDGVEFEPQYRSNKRFAERRYITCCCRLTPEKRVEEFVDIVIEAAPFLKANKYVPFLVGPPTDVTYAQRVSEKLKQVFPGDSSIVISQFVPVEQLSAIFCRTALNIHPATYEAYGMSIAEAAAFGAPTLMDSGGGIGCSDLLPAPRYSFIADMMKPRDTAKCVMTILRPEGKAILDVVRKNAIERSLGWDETAYGEAMLKVVKDAIAESDNKLADQKVHQPLDIVQQPSSSSVHTRLAQDFVVWLNLRGEHASVPEIESNLKNLANKSLYHIAADLMTQWNAALDEARVSLSSQRNIEPSKSEVKAHALAKLKSAKSQDQHEKLLKIGLQLFEVANEFHRDDGSQSSRLELARFRLVPSKLPEDAYWVILSQLIHRGGTTPDSADLCDTVRKFAAIVQVDHGKRGIQPVVDTTSKDELLNIANDIVNCSRLVLLSGFPCCETTDPEIVTPQESDGPAGAIAIAKAASALGKHVTLLVESVNAGPFHASAEVVFQKDNQSTTTLFNTMLTRYFGKDGHGDVVIEEFPVLNKWDSVLVREHRENTLAEMQGTRTHVLAIERAGPSADGTCKTMRSKPLGDNLLAPLHAIYNAAFESGRIQTSCVADGGNELGMGRTDVHAAVKQHVRDGESIACVLPSHHVLVCGVSNWGGYAVSAALAAVVIARDDAAPPDRIVQDMFGTPEEMSQVVQASMEIGGARDGVTGLQHPPTVDGLSLEFNRQVFVQLLEILVNMKHNSCSS